MKRVSHVLNLVAFLRGREPIAGPAKVGWEVTYRCDSRCLTCRRWEEPHVDELSSEEALAIVGRLARGGVLSVSFTGGEPLLRRDLEELVSAAARRGIATSISTNGWRLGRDKARSLAAAGLGTVFLSLDGGRRETHDRLRGRQGSFDRVVSAAEAFLSMGGRRPRVVLNLTINGANIPELPEVGDLAARLGVDGLTVQPLHTAADVLLTPPRELVPSRAEVRDLEAQLEALLAEHRELLPGPPEYLRAIPLYFSNPAALYRFRCVAAHQTAVVDPVGDLYPCPLEFTKLGSLREHDLAELWWSPEARRVREAIRSGKHPICWFDCVAPLNVVATSLARGDVLGALNLRLWRHLRRRLRPT